MPVFNQSRSYIIRLIFLVVFLVIVAQLVNLQLFSSKYRKLADENAILRKVTYPSRGIIFDRKGRAVLNNTLMFDLMITPYQVKKIDTALLCRILEIDTAEFKSRIINAVVKNTKFRPSIFEPLVSPVKYAQLEENLWRVGNGFYLQERPVRQYPFNAGAHFLGYVAEVSSREIERSEGFYRMGDYIGKSGLESYYENVLMGQRGVQFLLKDNKNRIQGPFENGEFDTAAIAGKSLNTYLDIELQQLAEKLLQNKLGAIVAIEPKTGGLLAMASGPSFNPNDLAGAEYSKNYGKLALDVKNYFLNRAIKGQYQPGSTYKPLAALIGLEEGVITPQSGIACSGAYYACGKPFGCTEHWAGHASNLRLAIAHSCNSFFYNTFRLTIDNPAIHDVKKGLMKWKEYANAFGYGHRLGVDLPSENGGNIPDTSEYNKDYGKNWNSCNMVTMGIGQDKMTVTPLQMANAICIVANKGYYYIPHFVKSIENETKEDTILNMYRKKHEVLSHIPDTSYRVVINGMHDVTIVGTAQRLPKIPGIDICAKTGTAQNYRFGKEQKDHSVFVCFAPKDDPKIAVAVIIENGGFGATWAGPMAYLMVEKYLNDTLRTERLKEAERVSNADLVPAYIPMLQYKTDSTRARRWFELRKDSSYIKPYLRNNQTPAPEPKPANTEKKITAVLPDKIKFKKNIIPKLA